MKIPNDDYVGNTSANLQNELHWGAGILPDKFWEMCFIREYYHSNSIYDIHYFGERAFYTIFLPKIYFLMQILFSLYCSQLMFVNNVCKWLSQMMFANDYNSIPFCSWSGKPTHFAFIVDIGLSWHNPHLDLFRNTNPNVSCLVYGYLNILKSGPNWVNLRICFSYIIRLS